MSESQRRKKLAEATVRMTEELTAKGMLVEAGYLTLHSMAFPNAPIDQVTFGRQMFFAGAKHLLDSVMSILDPGDEITDADLRRMELISDELDRFEVQLRKMLPTAGNA